ncbi:hypothetical protein X975_01801, partial [Stegodyphus mimosarum]
MAGIRFNFEERKFVLKCYWKTEDISEVRRCFRTECQRDAPARLTSTRLRHTFEEEGTVKDVYQNHSGRLRSSTNPTRQRGVNERFHQSPRKSVRQAARKTGVPKSCVDRILKRIQWRNFIPRLVHALNDDAFDRRLEFSEWYQAKCAEDNQFPYRIVWSDEATFNLNGLVKRNNCTYWGPNNSSYDMNGANYPNLLRESVTPHIQEMFGNEKWYFQQEEAPPHYHRDVRAYLDSHLPNRWVGRRRSIEYPPHSPDLNPLDFFCGGMLNTMFTSQDQLQ